jgi:hypothetical protein
MGLWSWLREPWSRPEAPQVSTPTAPADRGPVATPDPGWRALPPVQRTLADGVQSVARLGDFAGSLSTWQTPRMLTELEHGRGPSAPSGSAVGIVDAVSGRPGLTQLPAAGIPLTALPGSGTSAAVQREVRFDPPRGAVLQRMMSEAARSSAGVLPSEAPPTVVQRSDVPAASVPAAVAMPVSAGGSVAEEGPTVPAPSSSSPAASMEESEPAVQRSAADVSASTGVADQPGSTLGSTPLQSTLACSPAVLQRSAGTTERALLQLRVVPDRPAVHSFVTAPAPPTARPDLPIVAGRPEVDAGDGGVQRAFAPAPAAATPAVPAVPAVSTPTTASAVSDGPGPVGAEPAVPGLPGPGPVESSTFDTASPPEAPERAPLLADDPVREVPGEVTSVADDVMPTVSRLAAGSVPVAQPPSASASSTQPRRLGLGAPLTRPPEQVPTRPDVSGAAPVVQMLPVGGPTPEARPAEIPAAGPEPASSDAVQSAPAADLSTAEPMPSALPADAPEVGPEPSSEFAAEVPADSEPGISWPAAPDHGTPLLGDRPIATAMPTATTPAVQLSAADEVVPVRLGDPTEPGHAGPGPRSPSGSSPHAGRTGTGHRAAVQRSVGAPTPAGSTAGTAAGASVQRAAGSGAGSDPGSVAVHAGLAQRAADGSVVFHPPSDGPAASLQRFGLPSIPKMPSVPSLPSMPSMPSLPSMPGVPSLPSMPSLPNLPSGLPNMPGMPSGLPSLPNLPSGLPSLPNVPGMPSGLPSMPNLPSGLPSLPGIPSGLPSLPGIPSMPGIPDLPSMPGAVDEIRDRAGSAVSTASDAVSGAAGQAADTATGALGQAADTASGAVGQAVDAAKGAVGQATGAAGALAAASTDELVRRLFDPLAARLKAELRLDRERAGFVTDLRR